MSSDPKDERAIKTTLPMGSLPPLKPDSAAESDDDRPTLISARPTFPPDRWDRDQNVISSAHAPRTKKASATHGAVTLSGDRLPEALARELLTRRLSQAGYALEADYNFVHGETVVFLDGFDPDRRVGYQYISHADEDVVTDHDRATSDALKRLAASGDVHVLVVHDGEAATGDDLLAIVEKFLGKLAGR